MILKVIKRNGEEVSFEISKIKNAIAKANLEIPKIHQLNSYQIDAIADTIEKQLSELPHAANVEDIQDMVEKGIMEMRGYEVCPLPLPPGAGPQGQYHGQRHFVPDRPDERGGQAGEFQQEPGDQLHSERLYGR